MNSKIGFKTISIFFVLYGLAFFIFYELWYKNQLTPTFRFFNDATEWQGMDKCGHFFVAYLETWFLTYLYQISKQKPTILVPFFGFFCQLPIEILDGFSIGYGFSGFDLIANLAGSSFAYFQFVYWKKQIIIPQFSFFPTEFAAQRPELLGFNIFQQIIKDYNGQIYWVSFSPNDVLKINFFPNWLLISLGYGASNMLTGHEESTSLDHRLSNLYISIDINWGNFKPENIFVKSLFLILTHLKIPLYLKIW